MYQRRLRVLVKGWGTRRARVGVDFLNARWSKELKKSLWVHAGIGAVRATELTEGEEARRLHIS